MAESNFNPATLRFQKGHKHSEALLLSIITLRQMEMGSQPLYTVLAFEVSADALGSPH